jgi:hypothetical protein
MQCSLDSPSSDFSGFHFVPHDGQKSKVISVLGAKPGRSLYLCARTCPIGINMLYFSRFLCGDYV